MAPKELVDAVVRLGGLLFFVFALSDCFYIGAKIFGIPTPSHLPISTDAAAAIFFAALGLVILRSAKYIVRFAYMFDRTPNSDI